MIATDRFVWDSLDLDIEPGKAADDETSKSVALKHASHDQASHGRGGGGGGGGGSGGSKKGIELVQESQRAKVENILDSFSDDYVWEIKQGKNGLIAEAAGPSGKISFSGPLDSVVQWPHDTGIPIKKKLTRQEEWREYEHRIGGARPKMVYHSTPVANLRRIQTEGLLPGEDGKIWFTPSDALATGELSGVGSIGESRVVAFRIRPDYKDAKWRPELDGFPPDSIVYEGKIAPNRFELLNTKTVQDKETSKSVALKHASHDQSSHGRSGGGGGGGGGGDMESKIATLVPGEDVPLPIVIDPDPMEHTIVPPIGLQIEKSLPSWLSRILKKHDADV